MLSVRATAIGQDTALGSSSGLGLGCGIAAIPPAAHDWWPDHGRATMDFSSIGAVTNSLRLRRFGRGPS